MCDLLAALFQREQIALGVLAKASLLPPGFLPGVERFPQQPPASKVPWREISYLILVQAGAHTGKDPRLPS
jgi:hypothetical protein